MSNVTCYEGIASMSIERFECADGAHFSVCLLDEAGEIAELATGLTHNTRGEAEQELQSLV